MAALAAAAAGVSAGVELPPENNPVIPWPMAWPIPTPAAVDMIFESIPPPWETAAGGAAAGLAWAGVFVVGWAVRAGTLEEVEAARDCAGREGGGAGREGAERPPRCL